MVFRVYQSLPLLIFFTFTFNLAQRSFRKKNSWLTLKIVKIVKVFAEIGFSYLNGLKVNFLYSNLLMSMSSRVKLLQFNKPGCLDIQDRFLKAVEIFLTVETPRLTI